MLGILIVILVICALVAAIWGRESAKNVFGCIMIAILVPIGAVGWFLIYAMHDTNQPSSPSSVPASSNGASSTQIPNFIPSQNLGDNSSQGNGTYSIAPSAPTTVQPVVSSTASMPDLSGMDIDQARNLLTQDGFTITSVSETNTKNPIRPHGQIIEQAPQPGAIVDASTQIRIEVASGRGIE